MTLIGLTGGIGSGKSTVAAMMAAELGATVVDADAISRASTAGGGLAIAAISKEFGLEFVDATGALDRAKMRDLVFSDASAKARLEAIIHPLVKTQMRKQIETAKTKIVVLDLPLLAEKTGFNHWLTKLDSVWVVDCSEATQIKRVIARSNMTQAQVEAAMGNQATREARLAIADVVITNENINLDELKQVIIALLQR
jgi:dephospho-CoA kinase